MAGNFLRLYRHAPIGDPIKYLADLRSPHLLVHPSLITEGESPTEHTQHVSRTFQLSLQRLSKANDIDALALKALAHLACFAPGEPVPRFLLLGSLEKDDDDTAQIQATDALRRLVNLGLAESEGAGDLVLHRLLAAFVAATAEDFSEAREAVEVTVEVEADRLIDEGYPAPLQAWQGHLRAVTERAADVDSNHASDLLLVLGKFMREIAAFDEAQAAFERALVIEEATCGADHPNAGTVINELGTVLSAKGDLDGATEAYERALTIHEASFGLFHPRVATGVNNLGRVLYDKGDLDGAKDAFERALAIDEASNEPNHPSVAAHVNNLAMVLHEKGDLDDAKAAFERALSVFESVLGLEHPSTQRVKNNLDNLTGQAREADTGRNTLSMTDNTTFSGDFRGAIVNYKSTLIDVRQSVKALPNTDDTDKAELDRLLAELTAALEAVPADKSDGAEAVAVQAKALVDEVCKEKPNKTMLGISSDGLKKAAETISDVAPNVLKVAGQIVEFFGKFGG